MQQDTGQFNFHFSDISLPLRIAAVAILSVLAIVGIGSTARYAATLPKTETNTQATSNTSTNQSSTPTNDQTNPNIAQPQVNTGEEVQRLSAVILHNVTRLLLNTILRWQPRIHAIKM